MLVVGEEVMRVPAVLVGEGMVLAAAQRLVQMVLVVVVAVLMLIGLQRVPAVPV
jgi:hypothetical protein